MTGVRVAAVLGVVLASAACGTGAVAGSCIAKDGEVHLAGGEFQMGDDGFYAEEGPAIRLAVDGFAIDLECAPDECFSLYPRDGLLVHANHWQSPVALTKLEERGLVDSPDSLYRDVRVRDILERAHGAVTMQVVETALADRFGAPFAVCRPPCRSRGAEDFATVATIILAPAAGEMRICPSPWRNDTFTTYRLTG